VTTGPGPGGPELPAGTFRIDRDGVWLHEGVEVTHPGVLRNLHANLRAEGESYFLQVGPSRIPVTVDDAPYVVLRLAVRPDGALHGQLTDGESEAIDPATLRLDARGVPYCRVKAGRFRARLSVAAWLQLAPYLEAEPGSDRSTLVLGGRRLPIPRDR
jgi:uncharacterized protein